MGGVLCVSVHSCVSVHKCVCKHVWVVWVLVCVGYVCISVILEVPRCFQCSHAMLQRKRFSMSTGELMQCRWQ